MYVLRRFYLRYLIIIKQHTYSNTVSIYEFLFINKSTYIEKPWPIL